MKSLKLDNIVKYYGEHPALVGATLDATAGEVVAICGENGAGKSTLMAILAGSRQPTSGEILIGNAPTRIDDPRRAFDLGIRTVYQELSLLPNLSVTENLFLGELPVSAFGRINWRVAHENARREMQEIGMGHVDVRLPVGSFPVATQQMVEIAKALSAIPDVLILDEPTSVLTAYESKLLFDRLPKLKQQGAIVFYISHRLEEVLEIADRIVVLKDGATVDVMNKDDATIDRLVTSMVGRPLDTIFPDLPEPEGRTVLKVEGLSSDEHFQDIHFEIKAGEVLGFSGLVGSGRTEVARAIFGADLYSSGSIKVDGASVQPGSPGQAIKAGIGLVTEERKRDGLALDADILDNAGLASMAIVSRGPFLNRRKQREMVQTKCAELDVRPLQLSRLTRHLSGGNQQKVVLAKWMLLDGLKVLILDEPTRGVDIATKVQIYRLIAELAGTGVAVLLISSEMPVLLGLSHKICVFREGNIVDVMTREEADENRIFAAAANVELVAA